MFRSISTLLKKKFEFHRPLKKEYIIIEKSNLNEFLSIIKKNKVYLVNFNNTINFYVLIKLLIKFKKLNQLNYFLESIILSNPKIILTAIDSNPNFYKLKKYFPDKIVISVQNGIRTDLSFKKKNENLKSDFIFCNGIADVKFFNSRIKSKIIPFGTIKNNSVNNKINMKIVSVIYLNFTAFFTNGMKIISTKYFNLSVIASLISAIIPLLHNVGLDKCDGKIK